MAETKEVKQYIVYRDNGIKSIVVNAVGTEVISGVLEFYAPCGLVAAFTSWDYFLDSEAVEVD